MKNLWLTIKSWFCKVYIKYKHHREENWVRWDVKGKNRSICLCYDCEKFKPGTSEHCVIAECTYRNCVMFNTVTPVIECPKFQRKKD